MGFSRYVCVFYHLKQLSKLPKTTLRYEGDDDVDVMLFVPGNSEIWTRLFGAVQQGREKQPMPGWEAWLAACEKATCKTASLDNRPFPFLV